MYISNRNIGANQQQLSQPKPAHILLGFPPSNQLLNSRTTNLAIDKRTESKVNGSIFKTEVEEKVQNNNVELESFTDVDIDERTEPEVTDIKFKLKQKKRFRMTMSNSRVLVMLTLMKEQNQKSLRVNLN